MAYTKIPPAGAGDAAGVTLLFFALFSLVLAAIAIGLRIWVRRMRSTPLALNDWMLILGWVNLLCRFERSMLIAQDIFVGVNYCDCYLQVLSFLHLLGNQKLTQQSRGIWGTRTTSKACFERQRDSDAPGLQLSVKNYSQG